MEAFIYIVLELLSFFIEEKTLKKIRTRVKEFFSKKTISSTHSQNAGEKAVGRELNVCTSCNRVLKKFPVYEGGKSYCKKCYKTHVLKIN